MFFHGFVKKAHTLGLQLLLRTLVVSLDHGRHAMLFCEFIAQ